VKRKQPIEAAAVRAKKTAAGQGAQGCGNGQPKHQHALLRLKRIEGQVKGIQKMISEDKYCIDIITQISAVRAALKSTGMVILKKHIETCVADAIRSGRTEQTNIVDELIRMLSREDI
jgi:DNA-binding FrmR family transcriptional regulator